MNILQKKTVDNVKQLYRILLENTVVRSVLVSKEKKRILDVGVGNGVTAKILQEISGSKVQGLDISKDLWEEYKDIPVTIYNGTKFPFPDKEFHTIIIFLVLHHCSDPFAVLSEAKRTTKQYVLLLEEVKVNEYINILMMLYDWIVNLFIFGHSIRLARFKNEKEWEEMFERAGLNIRETVIYQKRFFLKRVLYVLERK